MNSMKYNMPIMPNLINTQFLPNTQGIIRPNTPILNQQYPNQQQPPQKSIIK
jgi:hypothetical protein